MPVAGLARLLGKARRQRLAASPVQAHLWIVPYCFWFHTPRLYSQGCAAPVLSSIRLSLLQGRRRFRGVSAGSSTRRKMWVLHSALALGFGRTARGRRLLPGSRAGSHGGWALVDGRLGPCSAARAKQAEAEGCRRQQQGRLQWHDVVGRGS